MLRFSINSRKTVALRVFVWILLVLIATSCQKVVWKIVSLQKMPEFSINDWSTRHVNTYFAKRLVRDAVDINALVETKSEV